MNGSEIYLLLFVVLVIVLVVQLVVSYLSSKRRAQGEPPLRFITSISCVNNDYRVERDFSEGDFVGKVVGSCPKCGAPLVIDRIFCVALQSPAQQLSSRRP